MDDATRATYLTSALELATCRPYVGAFSWYALHPNPWDAPEWTLLDASGVESADVRRPRGVVRPGIRVTRGSARGRSRNFPHSPNMGRDPGAKLQGLCIREASGGWFAWRSPTSSREQTSTCPRPGRSRPPRRRRPAVAATSPGPTSTTAGAPTAPSASARSTPVASAGPSAAPPPDPAPRCGGASEDPRARAVLPTRRGRRGAARPQPLAELARRGHDVHVACLDVGKEPDHDPGVTVHPLPNVGVEDPGALPDRGPTTGAARTRPADRPRARPRRATGQARRRARAQLDHQLLPAAARGAAPAAGLLPARLQPPLPDQAADVPRRAVLGPGPEEVLRVHDATGTARAAARPSSPSWPPAARCGTGSSTSSRRSARTSARPTSSTSRASPGRWCRTSSPTP